ncbi:hypothetical protein L484_005602 [Morus notabilis]|uniref:Uncharacterized protein n=1 Tax=Morus notabilis TaxID=981085 RepID=W9QUW4_9ROSA|nr:hypothetical protein L484_005602 [Morus notabilis]
MEHDEKKKKKGLARKKNRVGSGETRLGSAKRDARRIALAVVRRGWARQKRTRARGTDADRRNRGPPEPRTPKWELC